MRSRATTLAALLWLVILGTPVAGQEGRPAGEPWPSNERNAGPIVLPASLFVAPPDPPPPNPSSPTALPAPTPVAPMSLVPNASATGPSPAVRPSWALGSESPIPHFVPPDLDRPGQLPGWYAGVDLGIMKPHLNNQLTTPFTFTGPTGNAITLPQAPLDWVGVPLLSVGYRLGEGSGEFRLSYRLLASAGNEQLPGFDSLIPAQLRSRLDVQTIDMDYVTREYTPEATDSSQFFFRDIRGGVGMRVVSAFFDSHAVGTTITDTHVSSSYGGAGPRVFVELHRSLGRSDFQFYTRVAASGALGPIRQQFTQTVQGPGGPDNGVFNTQNQNAGMGILQAEGGFSWEPERLVRRLRVTAAYSWERWWNFARTSDSNAEFTLQGLLLRAEFKY